MNKVVFIDKGFLINNMSNINLNKNLIKISDLNISGNYIGVSVFPEYKLFKNYYDIEIEKKFPNVEKFLKDYLFLFNNGCVFDLGFDMLCLFENKYIILTDFVIGKNGMKINNQYLFISGDVVDFYGNIGDVVDYYIDADGDCI